MLFHDYDCKKLSRHVMAMNKLGCKIRIFRSIKMEERPLVSSSLDLFHVIYLP